MTKISKKFISLFWCILYCMPLVILLITYIGYLNIYKESSIIFISDDNTILSLFDLSVKHTNNTFSNFIWQPISDSFIGSLDLIGFNCENAIASFVLNIIVWFIQFTIIHIFVITLLLFPNMIKNALERGGKNEKK